MNSLAERKYQSVFALAIFLGTSAGLLDALAVQSKFFTTDRIAYVPLRVWLVAPAVWVVFSLVTAGLLLLVRLRPIAEPLLVIGVLGTLVIVRMIILFRVIRPESGIRISTPLALLVIAAIGFAAFRWRDKLRRFPIHVAAALVTALVAAAVIAAASTAAPRRSTQIRSPNRGPNIVLIILDTLRYDSSGLAPGASAQAPNLARFSSQAIVFDNAYSQFSWTLPSHFSMVTGYGPATLDMDFDHQHYEHERPTLAETLQSSGYRTGAILSNPYLNPGTGFSRGFDSFQYSTSDLDLCRTSIGFLIKLVPTARVPLCRMTAEKVTDRALQFLAKGSDEQPFFLMLNYMDAHLPYYVPRSFRPTGYVPFEPFTGYPAIDRAMKLDQPLPPAILGQLRDNYAIVVRYLDSALEPLLRRLDAQPNTIVLIVSDHGEQFGEHNLSLHGNSVYRQVLHVPLILRVPHGPNGRVSTPVAIQAIYGTLLGLSGNPSRRAGRLPMTNAAFAEPVLSLYRAPRGFRAVPPRLAEDAWSVILGDDHYIRYERGREEMYRWSVDPDEEHNLGPAAAAVASRGRSIIGEVNRSRQPGVSEEERHRFFSLGYMQ